MATTATPIFPQTIKSVVQQILPADTTSYKTLYTGAANGSRVENINVTSTDTANKDIVLAVTVGATTYILGTVQIPLNSGNTNVIFPVSLLQHSAFVGLNTDPSGNKYLYLDSAAVLKVKVTATLTAAKEMNFFVQGGDY